MSKLHLKARKLSFISYFIFRISWFKEKTGCFERIILTTALILRPASEDFFFCCPHFDIRIEFLIDKNAIEIKFNKKFWSNGEIHLPGGCGKVDNYEPQSKPQAGSEQILCAFFQFCLLNSLNHDFCCFLLFFWRIFIRSFFNHCVYVLRYCF